MRFGFAPYPGSEKSAAQYVGSNLPTIDPLDCCSPGSWKMTLLIISGVGLLVILVIVLAVTLTNRKKRKQKKKEKQKQKEN